MVDYIRKILRESLIVETQGCGVFSNRMNIPNLDAIFEKDLYFFVNKQLRGSVVYMSPDEYIAKVAEMQNTSVEDQDRYIISSNVNRLLDKMKAGEKIDLPYLMYGENIGGQEGRHRAMAAKEYGCDEIPVVIIEEVTDKEVTELALSIGDLPDTQAKELLSQKGFKSVGDYNMVKFNIRSIIDRYNDSGDTSLMDKVDEWNDTVKGGPNTTHIIYEFMGDYKQELRFLEIYDENFDYYYHLDQSLDYLMGRTYGLLEFEESSVESKKIDILSYEWEGNLPSQLKQHIQKVVNDSTSDDFELVMLLDEMSYESDEAKALVKYMQKMIYGSIKYDTIIHNASLMNANTQGVRINISDKGARVSVSNDIDIEVDEYTDGHDMLVRTGIVRDLELGFNRVDDMTDLNLETMVSWVNKFGLEKIK